MYSQLANSSTVICPVMTNPALNRYKLASPQGVSNGDSSFLSFTVADKVTFPFTTPTGTDFTFAQPGRYSIEVILDITVGADDISKIRIAVSNPIREFNYAIGSFATPAETFPYDKQWSASIVDYFNTTDKLKVEVFNDSSVSGAGIVVNVDLSAVVVTKI